MLFNLKDVFLNNSESRTVNFVLPLRQIELFGIFPFATDAQVCAVASNKTGLVELSVTAVFDYSRPCDRCNKPMVRTIEYSFVHRLVTQLQSDDDDDYITVPGFELELDDVVTADILLELPGKYLCSDDCKGLCPVCGHDLNTGRCDCDVHGTDPRLEILRQLIDYI